VTDEANFEGHWPDIEHRTAGSHRAWSYSAHEWCYPGAPCAHCDRWLRERAEEALWTPTDDSGAILVPQINPEPWTAPEVSIGRRGGKLAPQVFKREQLRQYQEALHDYIEDTYPMKPLVSDLILEFWFWRELDTPNSKRADATNLQKSTEDALHGLLFENDRQVQDVHSVIVAQDVGIEPTIIIRWTPYAGLTDPTPIQMRHALLEELKTKPKADNSVDIEPESIF
jgi:Holliday junction resolvase RusA-like endonuclease